MRPKKRSAAAKAILPEPPIKERINASAVNDDGEVDPEVVHRKMQMHIELKRLLQKQPMYLSANEIDFIVDLGEARFIEWSGSVHDGIASLATPEKAVRTALGTWRLATALDGWRVSVSRDDGPSYDPDVDPF